MGTPKRNEETVYFEAPPQRQKCRQCGMGLNSPSFPHGVCSICRRTTLSSRRKESFHTRAKKPKRALKGEVETSPQQTNCFHCNGLISPSGATGYTCMMCGRPTGHTCGGCDPQAIRSVLDEVV